MARAGGIVDIDSLDEFDAHVKGVTSLRGWRVQDVDLTGRTPALIRVRPGGAVFLGCDLAAEARDHLIAGGALLFPEPPELPFDAYRASLYTPRELYDALEGEPRGSRSYSDCLDARVYAWSRSRQQRVDPALRMSAALHDQAIDLALSHAAERSRVVGVMGGHAGLRGETAYRDAARLGWLLSRAGLTVATGGGPGTMEAANLGAYLGADAFDAVASACDQLSSEPSIRPSITDWARASLDVLRRWPTGSPSLGIPTWFYGHEPPNLFATGIAKYFQNSVREDVLLAHCDAGIAFLPGAAGTVQEIFQDACENYYAEGTSITRMVLIGRQYWSVDLPAWSLLSALARDRAMRDHVHLVDSVDEAAEVLA